MSIKEYSENIHPLGKGQEEDGNDNEDNTIDSDVVIEISESSKGLEIQLLKMEELWSFHWKGGAADRIDLKTMWRWQ